VAISDLPLQKLTQTLSLALRELPLIIFETQRLIARYWEPDKDAEQAFRIYSHPEVTRFIRARKDIPANVDEQRAVLADKCEEYCRFNDGTGAWALEEKETGTVVGSVIVKWLPDADRVPTTDMEIGWHLGRQHWGKGFATEAGKRAAQYALETLGQSVIYAVVKPANSRSVRVTQRLGMQPIGTTNKYYGVELLLFEMRKFAQQNAAINALKGSADWEGNPDIFRKDR
jgi:ribosomal-protein-alanine N-acetyltransferase